MNENPIGGRGFTFLPPFIRTLLIANVGFFLFEMLFIAGRTYGGEPLQVVVREIFALMPWDSGAFRPWQVITYQYMHGGFSHLFFNMFALWMFGMELENIWGSRKFAVFYTLSGIAAAIVHLVVSPILGLPGHPTVGASGSIMGVLLAFGLTFPTRPILMFPIFIPIPARWFVVLYAGISLVSGLMSSDDGVAHFAHLGGALGGYLLLRFGQPIFNWIDRWNRATTSLNRSNGRVISVDYRPIHSRDEEDSQHAATYSIHPPRPRTNTPTRFVVDGEPISQEDLDEILDKISRFGYHNLSAREKFILEEISRQM
jgi:membrane associated rhomboid family serine protease